MDLSKELKLREQTINLNAGPSPLPVDALVTAASSLLSYDGSPGMGVAEISHRSAAFQQIMDEATQDVRALLEIPDNYEVLWMQGGGLTQFSATVLNLLAWYRLTNKTPADQEVVGEYVVTGSWSLKAAQEGARLGLTAKTVIDSRKYSDNGKFSSIPPATEWDLARHSRKENKPAFIYYCDNETVDGVEFAAATTSDGVHQAFPFERLDKDVPVICDMSSNFFSRPVDVAKYGVIYGGLQKNVGPAGCSIVIVRKDLLVDPDQAVPFGGPRIPCMLSYKNMADSGSMYNTPPTFTIYVSALVLRNLLTQPPLQRGPAERPLDPLSTFAHEKSSLVYDVIDSSNFYDSTARVGSRSRMNATFRIKQGNEQLEKAFVRDASDRGIKGVSGHRSVGGIRTSLYNAVTLEQVKVLVEFMKSFEQKYSQ